jgi:hypothetical protein
MPALADELRVRHRLDSRWDEPTVFSESVDIAGTRLHMYGFLTRDADGRRATGSAAALDAPPAARAYYELLERTSILEAVHWESYRVFDSMGRPFGDVPREEVFPVDLQPTKLRYSYSNGVALRADWTAACRTAALELVERDRVLRSWYGEFPPRQVSLAPFDPPRVLSEIFVFEAHAFDPPSLREQRLFVRGMFAFPTVPEAPLVYGFAASDCPRLALAGAARECLQRLAFLWGESVPDSPPSFEPTAEYHQEVFLQPSMRERLRAWLAGEHIDGPLSDRPVSPPEPTRFADLTPPALAGSLSVARALPTLELGLAFGRGHPQLGDMPAELEVHPIA